MAIIENTLDKQKIILHSQHTIGRDINNISSLNENDVSRKHAVICWENNCWQLTDLSSNGTKLNSSIIHHATKKLKINDLLQFSSIGNSIWRIIDIDEPKSFLKSNNANNDINFDRGGVFIEKNQYRLTIFKNSKQKWVLDNEKEERELIHGEKYIIHDNSYKFIENDCLSKTVLNTDITKNACFQLSISNDEEHITSKIKINDLELDLGNRVFNHLLLYLIREKQKDVNSGINGESCGWVYMENLTKNLSKELLKEVDDYYINTQIHRLRKNLMNLPPYGFLFANIIERKKGQLRFGLTKYEIERERMYA